MTTPDGESYIDELEQEHARLKHLANRWSEEACHLQAALEKCAALLEASPDGPKHADFLQKIRTWFKLDF